MAMYFIPVENHEIIKKYTNLFNVSYNLINDCN